MEVIGAQHSLHDLGHTPPIGVGAVMFEKATRSARTKHGENCPFYSCLTYSRLRSSGCPSLTMQYNNLMCWTSDKTGPAPWHGWSDRASRQRLSKSMPRGGTCENDIIRRAGYV